MPPKPGVETRLHAIDYLYTRHQLFTTFAQNSGGTCPTLVPPLSTFFPPFIEFHYDAFTSPCWRSSPTAITRSTRAS